MTLRADLIAVRDAVLDGADWLDAMLAVAEWRLGGKRFVKMHAALKRAVPERLVSHSLTDFFLKKAPQDIAAFFDGVIAALPDVETSMPTWPTLGLPSRSGVA